MRVRLRRVVALGVWDWVTDGSGAAVPAAFDGECHVPPNTRGCHDARMRCPLSLFVAAHVLLPWIAAAQGLTGTLVGNVKDHQGGALGGAQV